MADDKMKVRFTFAAIGAGTTPVWTAFEAGIFEKNGLDCDLAMIRGSIETSQALLDGKVDFGNFASPAPLTLSLKGKRDLIYLTGGVNYMAQTMVARPGIASMSELKGKKLGKSRNAELDDLILSFIVPQAGLRVDDMEHVMIENQPDALAKMERGEIDACLFTAPWLFEATKRGMTVIRDPFDKANLIDYQLGGIVTTREMVSDNPELVRRMVKTYVEGMHKFKRDREFVMNVVFKKWSKIDNPEIARQAYDQFNPIFLKKPYPSLKGLQTVLTHLSADIPEAAKVSPERFADPSWLKELDDSGFIDELYAREPVPD